MNNAMEKVLLVTGASSDVGMSLIKSVYKDYKLVYMQYAHMSDALEMLIDQVSKEVEVVSIKADFVEECEVESLINAIMDKNVLPNNIVHLPAPPIYNKQFHKDEWVNYDAAWKVSVRSVFLILNSFIPYMAKERYGRIVFMLTSNTIDKPAKYQSCYTTVKYALLGLMKTLAVEYADKGITVNGISPDMMETKFLSGIPQMIIEQNAANNPLKRNIVIEDILPVFELFLSDAGGALTGENICISGGK